MCEKMAISVYILKIVEKDRFQRLQMRTASDGLVQGVIQILAATVLMFEVLFEHKMSDCFFHTVKR